jgi:hypothetical protein
MSEMPGMSHEAQVAEKARSNGYLLIPHGGKYVLVDLADGSSWQLYDALAEIEELLLDECG